MPGLLDLGMPPGIRPDHQSLGLLGQLNAQPQWGASLSDIFAAAAARQRQSVMPQGGRTESYASQLPEDLMIPKTPLDLGLMALGGPFGKAAKLGMLGLGAALTGGEAQAGPAATARMTATDLIAALKERLAAGGHHVFQPPNPNSLSKYLQVGKKSQYHEGVDPVGAVRIRAADHPGYGADFDFRPVEKNMYEVNLDEVTERIARMLRDRQAR